MIKKFASDLVEKRENAEQEWEETHTKFVTMVFALTSGLFVKHYSLMKRGEFSQ
jgi:hypothetical protein